MRTHGLRPPGRRTGETPMLPWRGFLLLTRICRRGTWFLRV